MPWICFDARLSRRLSPPARPSMHQFEIRRRPMMLSSLRLNLRIAVIVPALWHRRCDDQIESSKHGPVPGLYQGGSNRWCNAVFKSRT